MAGSPAWAGPRPGSPLTSSASRMANSLSIGTCFRTRRPRPNPSAGCRCSATASPTDFCSGQLAGNRRKCLLWVKSRHCRVWLRVSGCPLCAKSRHPALQWECRYGVQETDLALRVPLAGRFTKYWQMRRSPRRHCSTAGWPVASEKNTARARQTQGSVRTALATGQL